MFAGRKLVAVAILVGVGSISPIALGVGVEPAVDQDGKAVAETDLDSPNQQMHVHVEGDTDWISFNRRLDGLRYSELDEINADNVGDLEEVCRVRVSGPGPFSSGPILAGGALYLTAGRATIAINPTNCDVVWKTLYEPAQNEVLLQNRGAAYLDGMVFRGTGDARVLAYNATTGAEIWRQTVGDPTIGEYVSAAPIAWEGKVFVGIAGGDRGIQGRMFAFDAKTGKKLWTFNTVPRPGEFGDATWPGESWKRGGGGTWTSYSLDTETGELFVPVANPAPDLNPRGRRGDNLFTNSVLVLDARTGQRLWHYQTRKNDSHDYGISPAAVLVTLKNGRTLVAQASKDGYVYLIDRKSRKLIVRTPVTTILNHEAEPTTEGVRVCPGLMGGVEYNSPGYDPVNNALTVGAVDWCSTLFVEDPPVYKAGEIYSGGSFKADSVGSGWITSLDAATGKVRWKYHTEAPVVSAISPTAGGVTFVGDMAGTLYAFRSSNGELLSRIDTGGAIAGGIITYQADKQQYLAITSGNISRSTWPTASGIPTVVIYRKGSGLNRANQAAAKTSTEHTVAMRMGDPALGKGVYDAICSSCHGPAADGGTAPKLRGIAARYSYEQAIEFIKAPKAPMPALYPSMLSAQKVADVAAYIRSLPQD